MQAFLLNGQRNDIYNIHNKFKFVACIMFIIYKIANLKFYWVTQIPRLQKLKW